MTDRDPFADDVLERLARSNGEYQRAHGHYIVPLAERLLASRAECERLRAALKLADEAFDDVTRMLGTSRGAKVYAAQVAVHAALGEAVGE